MLNIVDNCENSLFLFLAILGICLLCVSFFFKCCINTFERKGHLKVIPKLQSEMSYIKNFLNVVYIF